MKQNTASRFHSFGLDKYAEKREEEGDTTLGEGWHIENQLCPKKEDREDNEGIR